MPASLVLYEDDDTTEITSFAFETPAGTPATAIPANLWNYKGAGSGDTAYHVRAAVKARKVSVGGPYLGAGIDVLDQQAFQIRVTGSSGFTAPVTGWLDMGAGAAPALPDLAYNTSLELEFRINPSASVDTDDLEFKLEFSSAISTVLGDGLSQRTPDGIVMRLGNSLESGIVRCGTVTENGTPDYDVLVDAWMWVAGGELHALWSDTVTVGATDGAAASLGAGEVYVALLTGANDGTITVTKGLKATSGSEAAPARPANEPLLATIVVDETQIDDADITVVTVPDYGGISADFSVIGPFTAIVDNRLVVRTSQEALPAVVNGANYLWVERTGSLAVTQDITAPPSAGALLLHGLTADATPEVTAVLDRRRVIGPETTFLDLRIDSPGGSGLSVSDVSSIFPEPVFGRRRCWIHPFAEGMELFLDDAGTSLSSGETSVDLQRRPAGGAFTTVFTTGALAQYPQVAYDNTDLYSYGHFAEVLESLPGDVFRAIVHSVPTGTTEPDRCSLRVHFLVV